MQTLHHLTTSETGRLFHRLNDLRDGLSGKSRGRVIRMISRVAEHICGKQPGSAIAYYVPPDDEPKF